MNTIRRRSLSANCHGSFILKFMQIAVPEMGKLTPDRVVSLNDSKSTAPDAFRVVTSASLTFWVAEYMNWLIQSNFAFRKSKKPTTTIITNPNPIPTEHKMAMATKGLNPFSFVNFSYTPTISLPHRIKNALTCPIGPKGPNKKGTGSTSSYDSMANLTSSSFDLFPSYSRTVHPSTKKKVGKARTPKREERARSAAPSILATLTLRGEVGCWEWRVWATCS